MSSGKGDADVVLSFDEQKWVMQVRKTLDEELVGNDGDDNTPTSIFHVPKSLLDVKPKTYTPQHVAIGPYHQWRTDLYEMERHKLFAARRIQKQLQRNLTFQDLVDDFAKHELRIRASYHKFLDINGETLAWMMVVDASFLHEFLQGYRINNGKALSMISSKVSHSSDYTRNSSTHNPVPRDLMMLENQIPLFLFIELLRFTTQKPLESLVVMLKGFYREVSPFKNLNNFPPDEELSQRHHLLELLYYMVVPKQQDSGLILEVRPDETPCENSNSNSNCWSYPKQIYNSILNSFDSIRRSPSAEVVGWALESTKLKFLLAPLQFLSKLVHRFRSFNKPMENILSTGEIVAIQLENLVGSSKLPLVEELLIPSVTKLHSVGVKFCPTKGNLTTIKFDEMSLMFYLPIITLDENSEVILRNLVAFEACSASIPSMFTRYTELMNGIIDTKEDVKLLREQGIILNHLRSDGEVANLWNSMSKSVKLTKVGFMDKVIEDVNRYYNGRWKVRAGKLMKKYVFGSWPLLTFLAAILLLILTCLQAFCSVYICSEISVKSRANVV